MHHSAQRKQGPWRSYNRKCSKFLAYCRLLLNMLSIDLSLTLHIFYVKIKKIKIFCIDSIQMRGKTGILIMPTKIP